MPRSYQHAFFSALTPGTHILKHHGPTNKKLRIHLPLIGVPGSELRVADTTIHCAQDQLLVFDDSFGVHVLFAFIVGALVVFNALAVDFNSPFSGLYRLESNTVAASLKQLRATIRPYVTTTPLGRVRPSDETAASLYGERVQLPNDL